MVSFSTQLSEVTSRVMSPKLRQECFRELSRTGIRHKILGMKPLSKKKQLELKDKLEKASINEIELLYMKLFPVLEE